MVRICTFLCLVLSVLALPGCTVYGEKPVKALSDATGGEGLERALWSDIQHKDWKDVDVHVAAKFMYVSPGGKLDRSAALEQFHKLDVKNFSLGDLTTELNGTVFVNSYTITLQGTMDGQPLPSAPQRRVSVWHQQKSGWMMISHAIVGNGDAHNASQSQLIEAK
jgi:hypothetical protein